MPVDPSIGLLLSALGAIQDERYLDAAQILIAAARVQAAPASQVLSVEEAIRALAAERDRLLARLPAASPTIPQLQLLLGGRP